MSKSLPLCLGSKNILTIVHLSPCTGSWGHGYSCSSDAPQTSSTGQECNKQHCNAHPFIGDTGVDYSAPIEHNQWCCGGGGACDPGYTAVEGQGTAQQSLCCTFDLFVLSCACCTNQDLFVLPCFRPELRI